MKYKLLRFSLLSMFVMLFGGFAQAADPEVTLDFSSGTDWGIPTSGTNTELASFTDGTYTIKLSAANNYKQSGSYLILGKANSYLELPAFNFDVEKIEVVGTSSASEQVKQNIYVGDVAVSTETTGAKNVTNSYEIAEAYQAAGNIYKLMVTSNQNTQIAKILIYKKAEGSTSEKIATTIQLSNHAISGFVGGSMDIPTATVYAGENPVSNATVTWSSSNTEVADINTETGKIDFHAIGKTSIRATFAGDDTYKSSQSLFVLTITGDPYTTLKALQDDATATSTPVTIEFNNVYVNAVTANNAYLADADGYGVLYYQKDHSLKAGRVINGTAQANLILYKGQTEITDLTYTNLTFTDGALEPAEKTIDAITTANQSTLVTLKNVKYTSDGNFTDGTNTIKFYDTFGTNVTLEADKAYDVTGIVILFNTTIEIAPRTADDIVEATAEPVASFRDIKADLTSTSLIPEGAKQWDDVSTGIAVAADGTLTRVDKDAANAAAIFNGKWHGTQYGWANFSASVKVQGCVKITLGGSNYGSGEMIVTNAEGKEVAKIDHHIGAMWSASTPDKVAVGYYRTNEPTTLNFSAADYLPYFAVEAIAESDLPAEVTVYNVTFEAGEGTGTAPKSKEVEAGATVVVPANTTLFAEGKTLTAWTDGTNEYKAGDEITVNENITLTPIFTANTVSLADRTAATTLVWQFGEANGVGTLNAEGKSTILVTQATIGENVIDVKMDIDANSGKLNNVGRGDKWAQCNDGTKLTIPAYNGTVVSFDSYSDGTGTTIGGVEVIGKTATYEGTAETLDIVAKGMGYIASVTAVYPAPAVAEANYYVVGNMTEWKPDAAYKMTRNTAADTEEYMFDISLTTEDQFKIAKSDDGSKINDSDWYPTGMGNNYGEHGEITADGDYTIYFRPKGDGNDDWFYKYIYVAAKEEPATFTFRNFEIDLIGDLLTADEKNQGTDLSFGVVVAEDGTQTRVAADNAAANVALSGTYHNDHGWRNFKAVVPVEGSVKITMSTCSWGGDVTVKNAEGITVATFSTQKGENGSGCYGGGKSNDPNIVSAEYKGEATTLTISGGNYVNYFAIEAIDNGGDTPVAQDVTATWDFANNCANLAPKSEGGSYTAETMASNIEGIEMEIIYNGGVIKNNDNSYQVSNGVEMHIPVKNAGDLVTVKGYPGYSKYIFGEKDNEQAEELTGDNTYKAKGSDVEKGYVAVTSKDGNNYYISISVVQYAPKEKITLDNEPATATFPFNEGTEGQKATFSNADYFLTSKVTHGSNWTIKDSQTYAGTTETRLEPTAQHNDNLTDDDAIRFLITPKPGFTFTPTKVSFKANRYGTDNGLIDAYWQNPDGTTVELETGIKPERNNTEKNTEKSYDITGATAGEGVCGLKLFLYHLQSGKQIGLADIVIEGTLTGTEKDLPVLASFVLNGTTYQVEDVFDDAYEATLEITKAEQMVSAENPLTDLVATSGEIGEVAYNGDATQCIVTIPMTAGETAMEYVLNVVFKPDFKLNYLDVEGNVLATQIVEKDATIGEFAYDIADVAATKDGYKARGWFKTGVVGEKFTTADVITADANLYAIQTEIEEPSTHKKYFFDLADKFFYAEDHEAFNPAGDGYYWHDAQHGWAFKNGNTVDLLVGPKAIISVTLCQFGSGTGIKVKKGDEVLETLAGVSESDGGIVAYNYEGEAGTLTLEMECGGEMYIHAVKIVNTSEINYDNDGQWYFVKPGDAGSFLDVLDVVNGKNAAADAERAFIFLPNGTYDLDATVKTAISGKNISIIGESMDKTIIVTAPDKSLEGLGKAPLFQASSADLYMQDLTLQNALDYYNAGSAGRAAVLEDTGTRTIGKNVRMLSYQDTYYSVNTSQQAYWEDCDIHGTVDFICGGGDIRFQNTTLTLEKREISNEPEKDGKGGRTITAPTTNTNFGYVFDGCKVVDLSEGKGDWNFGRTWQNEPICVYLNTTLDDVAKNTLIASRWTEKGMNNKDPKIFGEFGTKDEAGTDITPATNTITSFGGTFETILSAEQAAEYAYDKMFTDWDPKAKAMQVDAPAAEYADGNVTWSPADNGAIAYMLEKNGEFVAIITDAYSYAIDIDAENDALYIRAANAQGGFGKAQLVANTATGLKTITTAIENGETVIYNLAGQRVSHATKGIYIINGKKVVIK
ncbi:MAG: InlB B-repeat-containing protein [Prevotella sp.]|nr:InlB B-repeat-containing protein [Prevotella sp.]